MRLFPERTLPDASFSAEPLTSGLVPGHTSKFKIDSFVVGFYNCSWWYFHIFMVQSSGGICFATPHSNPPWSYTIIPNCTQISRQFFCAMVPPLLPIDQYPPIKFWKYPPQLFLAWWGCWLLHSLVVWNTVPKLWYFSNIVTHLPFPRQCSSPNVNEYVWTSFSTALCHSVCVRLRFKWAIWLYLKTAPCVPAIVESPKHMGNQTSPTII